MALLNSVEEIDDEELPNLSAALTPKGRDGPTIHCDAHRVRTGAGGSSAESRYKTGDL